MKEIWKDVTNYEGHYKVSNLGRVKSIKFSKERILKHSSSSNEYLIVVLCKDNKTAIKKIHQLVVIAFLNHIPCGLKLVVNHKNFIRTDNRLENLEIVTQRENANQKHLPSSSKYTGVCCCKVSKKWISQITIKNKVKNLGYFNNEIDAHNAYQNELKKLTSI